MSVNYQNHGKGYLGFTLFRGTRSYLMHRQVAEHFCNKPDLDLDLVVNHKDGNKKNNYYENLEWTTQKENYNHAISTGLAHRGENRYGAKLDRYDIPIIRDTFNSGFTLSQIARYFNVSPATIRSICYGIRWKHI